MTDLEQFSFIIPVLNEEDCISDFLAPLQALRRQGAQLILVDGGSTDNTRVLAEAWVDAIEVTTAGRARQMNAGAALAERNYLCFLHADTLLPADAASQLKQFTDSPKVWGRFDVSLSGSKFIFRVIATMMNVRSRLTGIATGDQAMFVSRKVFQRLNGFPELPLMEDVALSKKLNRFGRPFCIGSPAITSSRRWEVKGVWKTIFLMWKLRWQFYRGVSAQLLHDDYYGRH